VEEHHVIGLDFGTESVRGVLIDVATGLVARSATQPYPHGVIDKALPAGEALPRGWALQDAGDYTVAAEAILRDLGNGRVVDGIGLGFTASSPLPARPDGNGLS
jgi:L-ribulokinase